MVPLAERFDQLVLPKLGPVTLAIDSGTVTHRYFVVAAVNRTTQVVVSAEVYDCETEAGRLRRVHRHHALVDEGPAARHRRVQAGSVLLVVRRLALKLLT